MAGDQVAIQLPKLTVKEGSAFTATAYFRTRATGAAATPTSIKYRVDCLTTGRELTDWTTVSAASNVSIPITATHNAMQSNYCLRETKQLTVSMDFELSTQVRESVQWEVEDLHGSP